MLGSPEADAEMEFWAQDGYWRSTSMKGSKQDWTEEEVPQKGTWTNIIRQSCPPSGQNGPTFVYALHSVTGCWMIWEHRDEPLSTAETALKGLIAIGYPLTTLLVGEQ